MSGWVRNCCKECSDHEGWYHNQKYENANAEEKRRILEALAAEIARKNSEAARREAELAKEKRAAEARTAEAEKGGPPPPPPSPKECTTWKPDLHEMETQRTASIKWIRKMLQATFGS